MRIDLIVELVFKEKKVYTHTNTSLDEDDIIKVDYSKYARSSHLKSHMCLIVYMRFF